MSRVMSNNRQSLLWLMRHPGEASLFGGGPKAWGPLRSSVAWNILAILRLKGLWDLPLPLSSIPGLWEPLHGVYWHRLGGLKLLQTQHSLEDWARASSQHSGLGSGLEVAHIAFHSQAQTSGMWNRISYRGSSFPGGPGLPPTFHRLEDL